MSTQNIVDKYNLKTNVAIAEYVTKEAEEIYRTESYGIGRQDSKKHKLILRLYRLVCEKCYSKDKEEKIREEVILRTINRIEDL